MVDTDGSGYLEYREAVQVFRNMQQKMAANGDKFNEDEFKVAFKLMDTSGDGRLSFDELFGFFEKMYRDMGAITDWINLKQISLILSYPLSAVSSQ